MKQVAVIAGPSGSGKNTIVMEIQRRYPHCVKLITATTRAMRPGEADGVDHYFFTKEEFEKLLDSGRIIEHRYVAALDTYYGIYRLDLDRRIESGHIVLAEVDISGAKILKNLYDATTIFILPESVDQFRRRLIARNPEWTEAELDARMSTTQEELAEHAPQYDYRVVNADGRLAEAVQEIIDILQKEGYNLDA